MTVSLGTSPACCGQGETVPFPAGIAAGMPSSGKAARGGEVTPLSWLLCAGGRWKKDFATLFRKFLFR